MIARDTLQDLPGSDLVLRGLADLERGRRSAEAALVDVARLRLGALGVVVPPGVEGPGPAELRLYARLGAEHRERDPYPLYCAWLDQLDSFLWALVKLPLA